MTISFVRACFSIPFSNAVGLARALFLGAASFTIYSRTKEHFAIHDILCRNSIFDAALTGGISGAMSGALISFASARTSFLSPSQTTSFDV